jgi:hypothetical protein
MKPFKLIAFAALLTVSAFTITTYTACKDACDDVVCLNGGACQYGKCVCPSGYLGDNCEKTLCTGVKCENGGACVEGACQCLPGYEGKFCETLLAEKFLGEWKGTDGCHSGTHTLTIEKGITKNDVKILGVMGRPGSLMGTITESKVVVIQKQSFDTYDQIEGELTLENNKLIFEFTYYFIGGTNTCKGEYSR